MRLPEYIPDHDPHRADPSEDGAGWGRRAALASMACVVVLGVTIMIAGTEGQAGPPPQPSGERHAAQATPGQGPSGEAVPALPPAVPTWVSIPSIAVEAPLTGVGLDQDGWLEAPPQEIQNLAGWLQDAPSPGTPGTAVVVGHVDNAAGPAVFYGLGALSVGAGVEVIREDGTAARFSVYDIAVFDKESLPEYVYEDTGRPELRLITCGGSFSQDSGYQDNVVVFAHMTGSA
ncbi:class F sortase [Streptomyces radicis]|uniref:Sortase n=1 Tax=Streptomyces radicis TaxID=1750517 RepID=A0A3A9VU71_9ACTN|nr:class F sortase [Streptomyces radicis]RKN04448.1 sortase [Streptomyces radicis]RKN15216.1 sortase [Streptomyces radicis]